VTNTAVITNTAVGNNNNHHQHQHGYTNGPSSGKFGSAAQSQFQTQPNNNNNNAVNNSNSSNYHSIYNNGNRSLNGGSGQQQYHHSNGNNNNNNNGYHHGAGNSGSNNNGHMIQGQGLDSGGDTLGLLKSTANTVAASLFGSAVNHSAHHQGNGNQQNGLSLIDQQLIQNQQQQQQQQVNKKVFYPVLRRQFFLDFSIEWMTGYPIQPLQKSLMGCN
jgi:hypothetical protein